MQRDRADLTVVPEPGRSQFHIARSIAVENANDAVEVACNKPEAQVLARFDRAPVWVTLFGLVPAIILARSVSEGPG